MRSHLAQIGAPRSRRPRRRGQALIEFTFVFLVFIICFMSILEIARALNVLVTLNTVAYAVVTRAAVDDPLLAIREKDVEEFLIEEMDRYNPTKGSYLSMANMKYEIDLNHTVKAPNGDTVYFSKIFLSYELPAVFLPVGSYTIKLSANRLNQLQGYRPP